MVIPEDLVRRFADTLLSSRALDCENAESREDCVRNDLTRRLKCVCADLSSVEFEALVKDMTREQLRGERGERGEPGRKLGPC